MHITENYYIYMDKKLFGYDNYNTILLKTNKISENVEKILSNKLKEIDEEVLLSFFWIFNG